MININKNDNGLRYIKCAVDNIIDSEGLCDFFLSDVAGVIDTVKLNIQDIYYITDVEPIDPSDVLNDRSIIKNGILKDKFVDMFKEFLTLHANEFIILRMGYDDSEDDRNKVSVLLDLLIEEYTAAREVGFVDISAISGLEFSKTFVYNNQIASKFLEVVARYEIFHFTKGLDFSYDDIYDRMKTK